MGENHQSFAHQVPVTQGFTQVTGRRYKPPISPVTYEGFAPLLQKSKGILLRNLSLLRDQICNHFALKLIAWGKLTIFFKGRNGPLF